MNENRYFIKLDKINRTIKNSKVESFLLQPLTPVF